MAAKTKIEHYYLHPPVHTSALGCSRNCRRVTCGFFQLTHMSRNDHAGHVVPLIKFEQSMAAKTKTEHYYSVHNIATRVTFCT